MLNIPLIDSGAHVASTEAQKAYAREWYQRHKEEVAEWRQQNPDRVKAARDKYAQSDKGKSTKRANYEATKANKAAYAKKWASENKDRVRETSKLWNERNPERLALKWKKAADKLRMDILKHYGGDPPSCACCGERSVQFLAIDHINGDGNEHRKALLASGEIKGLGKQFHQWLKKNGFPEGFRILCHNCNMARGAYGECPHRYERLTVKNLYQTALRLMGNQI